MVLLASLTACRSLVLSSGTMGASMHVHATTGGTLTRAELAARVYTSTPADLAPLEAFLRAGGLGTHADIERNNGRVWITTTAAGTFAAYTRNDQRSHSGLTVNASGHIDDEQPLSIFDLDEETASICNDPALGAIAHAATAADATGDCRQFHALSAQYIYDFVGDAMLVDTFPNAQHVRWVPGDATVCEGGDCEIAGAPTLAISFPIDLSVNQGQPFTRWIYLHGSVSTAYRIQPNVCGPGSPLACDRDARGPIQFRSYSFAGDDMRLPDLGVDVSVHHVSTGETFDIEVDSNCALLGPLVCSAAATAILRPLLSGLLVRIADAGSRSLDGATHGVIPLPGGPPVGRFITVPGPFGPATFDLDQTMGRTGTSTRPGTTELIVGGGGAMVDGTTRRLTLGLTSVLLSNTLGGTPLNVTTFCTPMARANPLLASACGTVPNALGPLPQTAQFLDTQLGVARELRRLFVQALANTAPSTPPARSRVTAIAFNPTMPGAVDFTFTIDTDGDGSDDLMDLCPLRLPTDRCSTGTPGDSGDATDDDVDHIGDNCDLCRAMTSSDNSDVDFDCLGAPCDCDDDGDTCNDQEFVAGCPAVPGHYLDENPEFGDCAAFDVTTTPPTCTARHDLDGDGRIDDCDPDDDGDGVAEQCASTCSLCLPCRTGQGAPSDCCSDNCPSWLPADPTQTDSDLDGIGDVCDVCPNGPCTFSFNGSLVANVAGLPAIDGCVQAPSGCLGGLLINPLCLHGPCPDPFGALRVMDGRFHERLAFRLPALGPDEALGQLAALPDLDGDSVGEIAVGVTAGQRAGRVLILSGQRGQLIETIHGFASGDRFGASIASLGTMLAVGAPGARNLGASVAVGGVYFFDLRAGFTVQNALFGHSAGERFGTAIVALGDLNVDGIADLVVGAPRANGGAGRLDLVSVDGRVTRSFSVAIPRAHLGSNAGAILPRSQGDRGGLIVGSASALDGRGLLVMFEWDAQVRWRVVGAPGDHLGRSVSSAVDLDGDLSPEIAVGAPGAHGGIGEVRFFDTAGQQKDTLTPSSAAHFGRVVRSVDDVDGDGSADLMVGASSIGTAGFAGGVTTLFGGLASFTKIISHVGP